MPSALFSRRGLAWVISFVDLIINQQATAHESASEAELVMLARALGTLRNIDPSRGTLPAFGESEFQLMNKLIMWPRQKLFPGMAFLSCLRLFVQSKRSPYLFL